MTVHAAVMTVALIVLTAAGFERLAYGLILGLLVLAFGLDAIYSCQRRFGRMREHPTPDHRRQLDRVVRAQWLISAANTLIVAGVLDAQGLAPLDGSRSFVRSLIVAAAVTSVAVFASSVFDWYWVLPRLSGLVGLAPCESGGRERWALLTSTWLFHRGLATAIFAGSVVGVPLYMLSLSDSGHDQALWVVVLGGVTAFAGLYLRRAGVAGWHALNPPVHVGDVVRVTIDLDDELVRRNVYIVDVSFQGAKFKLLDDDDGRYVGPRFHTKGDTGPIAMNDLRNVRRYTPDPPLCDAGCCSGVNWYCRHNPLAHV